MSRDTSALRSILQALRLSSHIIQEDPDQLAGQLLARLGPGSADGISLFRQQIVFAKRAPWLYPRAPSLDTTSGPLVQTVFAHEGGAEVVETTSDGKFILSAGKDGFIRVWDALTATQIREFEGHSEQWIAQSSQGGWLLATTGDRSSFCNYESGQQSHLELNESSNVTSAAFVRDGSRCVLGLENGTLLLCESQTGHVIKKFSGHAASVNCVAITPDDRSVVSGSADRELRVTDLKSGRCIRHLRGHMDGILKIKIDPNGQLLVSSSWDNTLRVWDLPTGRQLHVLRGHLQFITDFVLLSDIKRVMSCSRDCTLCLWDLDSGSELWAIDAGVGLLNALSATSDGRVAAAGMNFFGIRVSNSHGTNVLEGHTSIVMDVTINEQTGTIVSASLDGTIKFWDSNVIHLEQSTERHKSCVTAVACLPSGKHALSAAQDRSVRIWNLQTGVSEYRLDTKESWISAVAVSPDGQFVIAGNAHGGVGRWEITTRKWSYLKQLHSGGVMALTVDWNNHLIVTAARDRSIRLSDLDSGEQVVTISERSVEEQANAIWFLPMLWTDRALYDRGYRYEGTKIGNVRLMLRHHTDWVHALALSPCGQHLATASWNGSINVWKLPEGELEQTLAGHTEDVLVLAWNSVLGTLISGSADGTLRVWNSPLEKTKRTSKVESAYILHGHRRPVEQLILIPTKPWIASASSDGEIRVWSINSGVLMHVLAGHTDHITDLSVDSTGTILASVAADHSVRVWDLDRGTQITRLDLDQRLNCVHLCPSASTLVAGDWLGGVHVLELRQPLSS